jgi:DtxR family manganese transport transcriptional regulator
MKEPVMPEAKKTTPEKEDRASSEEIAARFERIRQAHQSEIAEDYVEMIADLIAETGEARAVDLASRFGVTAPTVNATVQRLVREGLAETQPYRSIFLTEAGRDLAASCAKRHTIVRDFLVAIGVDPEIAETDAEGLEHHVSTETLDAFKAVIADRS